MKQKLVRLLAFLSLASFSLHGNQPLHFELTPPISEEKALTVNFQDVSMLEFLRFVSEITEKNFIYDEKILDFNISLVTGKATNPEKILDIMMELLKQQGIKTQAKEGYYLVEKMEAWEIEEARMLKLAQYKKTSRQTIQTNNAKNIANNKRNLLTLAKTLENIQKEIQHARDKKDSQYLIKLTATLESIKNEIRTAGNKQDSQYFLQLAKNLETIRDEIRSTTNEKTSGHILQLAKNLDTLKTKIQSVSDTQSSQLLSFHEYQKKGDFFVYKLQYHVGAEILSAIKNVAATLKHNPNGPKELVQAIDSMQWVESTNSILYSGTETGIDKLTELIQSLDVPKKQVFIEVLVIETDVRKGLEFGLEWGMGGKYKDKIGMGLGNFQNKGRHSSPFAKTFQGINGTNTPTGTDQFPLGRGFDLGIIGDIILHKGASYLSLGSLVSALQADGDSTIVLNQKIITQDNKLSKIFVGSNLAFTGSTVETIGSSQQTSANIEYRDVGVQLNITPLLGNGDVITLEISEEITNVIPNDTGHSDGIDTTKTNMATQVHVPDQSFLVLSGMIHNTKRKRKSGIPCLGGLPYIGAAFSKSTESDEKRNIIVFVRPQIIHSENDHKNITAFQENQFKNQSISPTDFQEGIDMLQQERTTHASNTEPESTSPGAKTSNAQT